MADSEVLKEAKTLANKPNLNNSMANSRTRTGHLGDAKSRGKSHDTTGGRSSASAQISNEWIPTDAVRVI